VQKDASFQQKKEQKKFWQGGFIVAANLAGPPLFFIDKKG
jgi:hypothetical protein